MLRILCIIFKRLSPGRNERGEGEEKEVGEKKREKEWKGKGKMFKKTAVGVGKSELESR